MTEESQRPLKVFLCHAHSDRDAVRELYTRLKRDGVDAWLDKANLLPGQDWAIEIRKAVAESDVVIVCLSKQFNQEGFRQKEVRIALDAADMKPPETIFVIPIRFEECEVPDLLSRWHWVNLFEKDGYRILHRALTVRAGQIGANLPHKKSGTTRPTLKEEIKPIVAPQQTKEEKPTDVKPSSVREKLPKKESQPVSNTNDGKNVSESVIVTGNNNVINLMPAKQEEKRPEPPKQKAEKRIEPKGAKTSRKLSTLVWIALIGLIGIICVTLINSSYIYSWLTSKPAPTATRMDVSIPSSIQIATSIPSSTFVFKLPTSTSSNIPMFTGTTGTLMPISTPISDINFSVTGNWQWLSCANFGNCWVEALNAGNPTRQLIKSSEIYIDENWGRPFLIFWQKYSNSPSSYGADRNEMEIDINNDRVQIFSGTRDWHEIALDLSSYKGQTITVSFELLGYLGNNSLERWSLSGIKIFQNFSASSNGTETILYPYTPYPTAFP